MIALYMQIVKVYRKIYAYLFGFYMQIKHDGKCKSSQPYTCRFDLFVVIAYH